MIDWLDSDAHGPKVGDLAVSYVQSELSIWVEICRQPTEGFRVMLVDIKMRLESKHAGLAVNPSSAQDDVSKGFIESSDVQQLAVR